MSVAGADPAKHEILIIKRHGGDHDDGHHGGAWKIAFADFMTAMMCFFLVMWLINAANEQTKASVASYFNPVKLIDRNSSRKGLEDIGDGPNAVGTDTEVPEEPKEKAGTEGQGQSGPSQNAASQDQTESRTRSDEHLFADPYAVLAEIAAETGKLQNVSAKGEGGAQDSGPATGASGGESYRDPFAPDFWSQQVTAPEDAVAIVDESVSARNPVDEIVEPASETEKTDPAGEAIDPPVEKVNSETEKVESTAENPPVVPEKAVPMEPKPVPAGETQATPDAIAAAEKIRDQLNAAFAGEGLADNVNVTVKDSTVIVAVTDELDFGMFEIGSAMPRAELVRAMEKIGRIVAAQPGEVEINGHTDARPFKGGGYDNWRLSSARAQAAYYMLARGGLEETRIKQVSGLADRRLKLPEDPFSAVNRRIEILIETKP